MTSNGLEKLRQRYQDIETLRKKAVKLLMNEPKTVKEEAYVMHHAAGYARAIQNTSREILVTLGEPIERSSDPLADFYSDLERRIKFHEQVEDGEPEGEGKEEEEHVEASSMNDLVFDIKGTAHLSLFYDNERYQEWRRQRKREGNQKAPKKRRIVVPENDEALIKFNGEECFGQFLDLTEIHRNLGAISSSDYIGFLETLEKGDLSFVPRSPQGEQFLEKLVQYLFSFLERSQPFLEIDQLKGRIERSFSEKMKGESGTAAPNHCVYCDKSFESDELLQAHLKQKSHARNVERAEKCGGLAQFLEKRKATKQKFDELCFQATALIDILRPKIHATIENCKRRQTMSAAVMQAEQNLDAPIVFNESDQEDEEHFYNPKGLPLGWDGKPIPYWLYKLHGLSVEYKCEICGNRSYWGALAFERHFFDARHINGLKALGIPPTRHFVYVTGVNEAIALFDKIKRSLNKEVWQPGDEEIETDDGQVMSRKIYEDLVRQGIVKPKST